MYTGKQTASTNSERKLHRFLCLESRSLLVAIALVERETESSSGSCDAAPTVHMVNHAW